MSRFQANREAKYDNPFGRNHPKEQTPHHTQDGAGEAIGGQDMVPDDKIPTPVDPADLDDAPQGKEHKDVEELLQDATLDLGDQQQQHLQELVADLQQLTDQDMESEDQDDTESGSGDRGSSSNSDSEPDPPPPTPPAAVESDDDMAGTQIGIPKFTGQETDVSDKAKDWLTGLLPTSPRRASAQENGRKDVASSGDRSCRT